jgi:hypothetical protein
LPTASSTFHAVIFSDSKGRRRSIADGILAMPGMLLEFAIHDEIELRGCMASVDK